MSQQDEVRRALDENKETILAKPNVVGVGVGFKEVRAVRTSQLSIVTLVRQKVPAAALGPRELVPPRADGIPTDVVPVGDIRALQARTDRWRPVPGGVSIGHYLITAGTFGAVVRDRATGVRLILSNNHVMANSNDAIVGDPILQPGVADGGLAEADTFAHLERFCRISYTQEPGTCGVADAYTGALNFLARVFGFRHRIVAMKVDAQATNTVDAAVARPVDDSIIRDDILEIGTVSGTLTAELGMPVRKSGRTTGLTTGTITVLDATVDVSYGEGRTARFENQIVGTAMSQGGDSGSLAVAADSQQAVGLLFAGSPFTTVFNPIQAVLDCLEVTF